jgi:chromate transporter
MKTPTEQVARPSFAEATWFWWKLGWISFGGTAAHIAIMHEVLVDQKQWVDNDHFLHALSHSMLLPGPEAQQLAIYLGWKLHGTKGGIVAGSFFILPSMFVLLGLSVMYVRFGTLPWVAAMFGGLKPAVVALVILALVRIARRALITALQWIVALGSFLAIACLHASIPLVMLVAVALGLMMVWRFPSLLGATSVVKPAQHTVKPADLAWKRILRSSIIIAATAALLWLLPLLSLYWFSHDFGFWKQLSLFFTQTAFVTVGGSYTVIPYVSQIALTRYHWLSHAQMLDGFALAETTPGPLIIVVAFIGFMAGFNHFHGSLVMGTIALLVTTFYTFLPCFLFVFAGAPFVEFTQGNRIVGAGLSFITAVVVAAMLDLTLFLVRGVLFPTSRLALTGFDGIAFVWIGISLLLLRVLKINVVALIGLSIFAGMVRLIVHLA